MSLDTWLKILLFVCLFVYFAGHLKDFLGSVGTRSIQGLKFDRLCNSMIAADYFAWEGVRKLESFIQDQAVNSPEDILGTE